MSRQTDRAIQKHSGAVREERTQQANDERLARGETPQHCGKPVRTNALGDYECVKCGAIF